VVSVHVFFARCKNGTPVFTRQLLRKTWHSNWFLIGLGCIIKAYARAHLARFPLLFAHSPWWLALRELSCKAYSVSVEIYSLFVVLDFEVSWSLSFCLKGRHNLFAGLYCNHFSVFSLFNRWVQPYVERVSIVVTSIDLLSIGPFEFCPLVVGELAKLEFGFHSSCRGL
jgi:hypothetical protein